jgi:hypothetical protein
LEGLWEELEAVGGEVVEGVHFVEVVVLHFDAAWFVGVLD